MIVVPLFSGIALIDNHAHGQPSNGSIEHSWCSALITEPCRSRNSVDDTDEVDLLLLGLVLCLGEN
jgi:hypothetical protein